MLTTTITAAQIHVNGLAQPLADLACVADLLAQLKLDARTIAIEHNLTIIPRSAYATTPLTAGDRIEIVGFIGGG